MYYLRKNINFTVSENMVDDIFGELGSLVNIAELAKWLNSKPPENAPENFV